MSSQEGSPEASNHNGSGEHEGGRLGFFLCWAVVFADIGTSVYYTPGILFNQVGRLAGLFVTLTMVVFILLTLKYSEVTYRYPQGGGVVTVSANAMRPWVGALGGMFILVDYFLTAAISSLSGLIYFSVVAPAIGPWVLPITIVVVALLGLLNWWGVSESASVSAVGAVIAFVSDIAILIEVFANVPLSKILQVFTEIFSGSHLTPIALLTGFAGSFLAFSGLESISQLSPVMKTPRKRTGRLALLLVVLTVGVTSPLLTIFSTTLLDAAQADPNQFISLLAGHFNTILGIEVAISAAALLIFASNTAIIGSYHVFLALSRMHFFPKFVERRGAWRGTPHYSIALATGIPILVLILVRGNITILGDMYAFGLLGAFSLTCLGLDIVRHRERKRHKEKAQLKKLVAAGQLSAEAAGLHPVLPQMQVPTIPPASTVMFVLGIITTALVMLAWGTNLVAKPLATGFGGTVTAVGLLIAYWNYQRMAKRGRPAVYPTEIHAAMPGSVLAVLPSSPEGREAVIRAACKEADHGLVVFLYRGKPTPRERAPQLFETVLDPYFEDEDAKEAFGEAETIAREMGVKRLYIYLVDDKPDSVFQFWQVLRPRDTIIVDDDSQIGHKLAPDRVRHSPGPSGQVTHYIKNWQAPAVVSEL
ncbi:MAG TPA: APC family permease [Ktedonobacterales bacterium]|nr:APC family permease [Ktedonobacterales bacterium]